MSDRPAPAYERIAGILRGAIASGDLPEGSRLPSLRGLAATHDVSLDVVRDAVRQLRQEGLLTTRQGAGVYVRKWVRILRASPARLSRDQWGAGRAIQDHDTGPRPRTVDVVVGDEPAPAYVAEALGVEPGAMVLTRSRRFLVDDRSVQLATSYLPIDLTRGTQVEHTDTGPGGLYARLAEQGHGPTHFEERIISRAPYPDEATRLDLDDATARVHQITRYAYAGPRCVEVNRMILDADAYELAYYLPA